MIDEEQTTMDKRFSCAETAQLIRAELKAHYPAVKFSVTSKVYSGGASITVRYTDGPATKDVERVVQVFEGASFDGMIDLKSYKDHILNGQRVSFGADYVFVEHKWSDAQREAIHNVIYAETSEIVTRQHHDYWRIFSEYATNYARQFFPTHVVTNAPQEVHAS